MCEAHAYMLKESGEERLMENVVSLDQEGDEVILSDLFGDVVRVKARIRQIGLLEHKIFLEPVGETD
ncbi:MAG: hypothetical protein Kow00129_13360 [Thermoleophilia bacterium]